jgi:hypothetical protein
MTHEKKRAVRNKRWIILICFFFPPEGGVGLVPKRGCLLSLAYYALPRWYEFGERRWNDIDRENRRTRRKTCPSATLSTTNPTWIEPGANPGLRGERPATNDLSYLPLSSSFSSSFPFPFVPLQRRGCLVAPLFLWIVLVPCAGD